MKLHFLITAVMLSSAVLVQAQVNPDPDVSIVLAAGTLGDVVAEIERRWVMPNIIYAKNTRDAVVPGDLTLRGVTPVQALTLVAAAADCQLEPIFSPAEEVAEAGGVGGGGGGSRLPQVIGYRIVQAPAPSRGTSPVVRELAELAQQLAAMLPSLGENHPDVVALRERIRHLEVERVEEAGPLSGVGLVLLKKDGDIVIGQVVPGSPASLSSDIRPGQRILSVAEAGEEDVDVTGLALEKVVQQVRGPPGTPVKITLGADTDQGPAKKVVSLVRAIIPLPPSEGMLRQAETRVSKFTPVMPLPPSDGMLQQVKDDHRPFVKVYALGAIFTGSVEEIGEKKRRFEDLVRDALGQSEPEGDDLPVDESSPKAGTSDTQATAKKPVPTPPEFSYHYETQALVVKATRSQHEIVEQVIKALKENASQPAAPGH